MESYICENTNDFNQNEYRFMITPCHWNGIAIKRSNEYQEGLCPICGAFIYAFPNGAMGHYTQ